MFILNLTLLLIFINYTFCIFFSKLLIILGINTDIIIYFNSFMVDFNIYFMTKFSIFKTINLKNLDFKGKRIIINCNHLNEVDDLLILVILKKIIPNFTFKNVKSVSSVTTKMEEEIFDEIGSIVINKKIAIKKLEQKIDNLMSYDNLQLILFLEGESNLKYNQIMNEKTGIILKNLNYPKTSIFNLLCSKKYFDYLVDVNVVYHNNKKILGKKDFFYFLDSSSRAKLEVKIYDLPDSDYENWALKLFQKKDIELETIKKNINNIK